VENNIVDYCKNSQTLLSLFHSG